MKMLILQNVKLASSSFKNEYYGGTWVALLVERLTLAQVMMSWFMGSSPPWGSLLSAQSLLRILCPPLTLALPAFSLSLFQK